MSTNLPRSSLRVMDAAARLGISTEIIEMPDSTRTAQEAARACGCDVAQIVKSLIFKGSQSGRPLLLLVSGANRVDERVAAEAIGEAFRRADADFVRETTGYAIGGIPPFGHDRPLRTYMDRELLGFDVVWAAAGTPRTIMRLKPASLLEATRAELIAVH